jgi:hypothetical protein
VVSGNKRLDSGADVAQAEEAAVTRKAAGIVLPCQNDALQRVQGDLKILWAPGLARAAFKDRVADDDAIVLLNGKTLRLFRP